MDHQLLDTKKHQERCRIKKSISWNTKKIKYY
uniref:Uncharacterized protein n=1 Tax=Arundo donax TaxID=35708 RepID=A0A0A8XV50_ARUDO